MATGQTDSGMTHLGMRYGVLDLIRCTEQTAILMAGAEGRGIKKEEIAKFGTLSMAAYVVDSIYAARRIVYDELYEREQRGRSRETDSAAIWGIVKAAHKDRSGPRYQNLQLDFCFAPVDGKYALSQGQTGGTVSSLCFARHDEDNPVFAPPRGRGERKEGRGHPAEADLSPPWLVICGSKEFVDRHGGQETLTTLLRELAEKHVNRPLTDLLFDAFHPPSGSRRIVSVRPLAVLDEPRYYRLWNRQATPDCKKRVFVGSSVALALAALLPNQGFDCSIAITRHAHAVQASVAARTLGGTLIAVPLYRVVEPGETQLNVESTPVWTHNDFVRHHDAALIISGISENVVLKPVRVRRSGVAEVHTISLSARTGSMRMLEHRVRLNGDAATRFVGFDASPESIVSYTPSVPPIRWLPAEDWYGRFEKMHNAAAKSW
jgi:fructose-1,6-bisphosphatase/sedoheptulose 1,7-bisphosphatase-like protein